jgi:outer membrane biosynthesis protein TonB
VSDKKKNGLGDRVQKEVMKRAMGYLATPGGIATVGKVLKGKKKMDKVITDVLALAGLSSLRDKQQVEWAIERQNRRIRDLTGSVEEVEAALGQLEKALTQPAAKAAAKPRVAAKAEVARPKPKVVDLGAVRRASAKKKAVVKQTGKAASAPKPEPKAEAKPEKTAAPRPKPAAKKTAAKKPAQKSPKAPLKKSGIEPLMSGLVVGKAKAAESKEKTDGKKAPPARRDLLDLRFKK